MHSERLKRLSLIGSAQDCDLVLLEDANPHLLIDHRTFPGPTQGFYE